MKKHTFTLLGLLSALLITCTGVFAAGGDMGGPTQDGSANHPYLIEDFNDFQAFCDDPNYWAAGVYAQLDCDLDLDPNLEGREIYDMAPIAGDTEENVHFREFNGEKYAGIFDGNDYIISNLTITGTDYCGLFGETAVEATIKNIAMLNTVINNNGEGYYAAPLVSYNGGNINNCYTENSNINANGYVSALVGQNMGNITNCHSNNSNIYGSYSTSTLAGSNGDHHNYIGGASIIGCYSTSGIINSGGSTGGLVAINYKSEITNCSSSCEISGGRVAGGLVGLNQEASISDSWSAGSTIATGSSTYNIGGLVGINYKGEITNCHADQTVSGGYNVGGLIGDNTGNVVNCYSTGTAKNLNSFNGAYVGGLIGKIRGGDIENCYSTAAATGDGSYVGGLAGYDAGNIINCYATGDVNCLNGNYVGGLVGYASSYSTNIINCYATGNVNGLDDDSIGGLVGDNHANTKSCFWDVETSGIADPEAGVPDTDGMIGKTTTEMKTQSTFTDASWDFVNVWGIGQEQTYPYLREYSAADISCDGLVNFVDLAILADNWLGGM